ncbi:hypothetical protein SADUNF_Sadunf09G0065400 [Salix dunnii]|uniref:inorganic diphosphatase n=1 Tax=Salix dunnii TaxID=1413687 RepID=A0A835JQS6_9ROSI|nr:hypothetical protein SADUNF_Sadunf09G0065400 [Salix dunnii]
MLLYERYFGGTLSEKMLGVHRNEYIVSTMCGGYVKGFDCYAERVTKRIDESLARFSDLVISASPLAMGLQTENGPPEWHPASPELKIAMQYSWSNKDISSTLIGMNSARQFTRSTLSVNLTTKRVLSVNLAAKMATAKVMSAGTSTATSCSLLKRPFFSLNKKVPNLNNNLRFNTTTKRVSKRSFSCKSIYNPSVQIKELGQPETLDYRVYFLDNSGKKVSPWHDIPLHLGDGVFNFVVEIPKESSAKMEIATDEQFTPIKQDTKKGKLRYYPYNINWNYGLLPQTWEDPSFANAEVEGAFGDNDPVDVVEIGERRGKIGEILKVKPLAALAMIDEGELDWKIVAISLDDPRASLVNDVNDVEKHFPGTITAIRDWFRDYKIPDGKPANKFGLGNEAASKDYALKVITEANESWAKLIKRSIPAGELSLV